MDGDNVGEITLPDPVFGASLNMGLLHSVVKAYQANRRQGTHATKTRSLVSGSGAKPFRQKGTGRARQGSTRGPHQYHGAVAHGPQPRNYRQFPNKKMKQQAMRVALSDKVRWQKLLIVDQIELEKYSTKLVRNMLIKVLPNLGKTLVVDERQDDLLYKSLRNMHMASSSTSQLVNAEDILLSHYLILTKTSLHHLCERLS